MMLGPAHRLRRQPRPPARAAPFPAALAVGQRQPVHGRAVDGLLNALLATMCAPARHCCGATGGRAKSLCFHHSRHVEIVNRTRAAGGHDFRAGKTRWTYTNPREGAAVAASGACCVGQPFSTWLAAWAFSILWTLPELINAHDCLSLQSLFVSNRIPRVQIVGYVQAIPLQDHPGPSSLHIVRGSVIRDRHVVY